MNKKNIIIYAIILTIIIPIITAYSSTTTYNTNITIISAFPDANDVYIVCNNCSNIGQYNGIIKYNTLTNTYSDFSITTDNTNITTSDIGSINVQRFFKGSTYTIAVMKHQSNIERIYGYNYIINKWVEIYTLMPTSCCGFPAEAQFLGMIFLDSTYRGEYNAMGFGMRYLPFTGSFYLQTFIKIYNNSASNFIDIESESAINAPTSFHKHSPVMKTTNPSIDTHIYFRNKRLEFNKTFTTINTPEYRNAWYNNEETIFYMISIDGKTIYISNDKNNLSNYTTWNTLTTCSQIRQLPNLELNDIACKNENECVIVGKYTSTIDTALAFQFNGNGCEMINIPNPENKTIYTTTYNTIKSTYLLAGKNYFGEVSTIPFNNTTITSQLCTDENYLCLKPIFVNNFYYCNIDDYVYCSNGCNATTNTCNTATCQNECYFEGQGYVNIIGYTGCINNNQFAICGNYDNDNCLELSEPYLCPQNSICAINTCEILNTNIETLTYPNFRISYELINNSYYDYINNRIINNNFGKIAKQTLNIETNAINTKYAYDCDYSETLIINTTNNEITISSANNKKIIIENPINDIILTYDIENIIISINDTILKYNNIPLFNINNNTINRLTIIETINSIELMIELNDLSKSKIYSKPISKNFTITKIIGNNTRTIINRIDKSLPAFNRLTNNQLTCVYTNNGCKNIKVFLSYENYGYLNSKDLIVCINNVDTAYMDNIQKNDILQLFSGDKSKDMITAMIIMFVSIITILLFGMIISEMPILLLSIMAIGLFLLELIYFTMIGIFPIWIIILLIILCGFIIVLFFKGLFG